MVVTISSMVSDLNEKSTDHQLDSDGKQTASAASQQTPTNVTSPTTLATITSNYTNSMSINNNSNNYAKTGPIIKPTPKRYVILFLFALNAANKAFQWIQIPASTKKVTYFYDVENFVINATSVLFMMAFVFLSIPACYIIEHMGMRNAVLLGSLGTALGAAIKCFSCHEEGIYLLFLGQTIVSLSEQLIFSVPSRLASVWFPNHQVSSAVAMCVLGNQLGVALGFLVPEFVLQSAETKEEIGEGLYLIFFYTALVSLIALIADIWLFDEEPKYAPGDARLKQIEKEKHAKEKNTSFSVEMATMFKTIRQLLRKKSFNLLCLSYGINVGIGYTIATVLNQMLEPIWPDDDILVGNTGFIIILFGALGSPLWGQLLDSARRYKAINVFLTIATILTLIMFGYVVSFMHSAMPLYVAAALFGAFQTGLLVAGLEFAVELTYPAPELVTSSLMNITPQICGSVFIFIASYLVDNHGEIWTHAFYVAVLLIALIMLMNIRETLRRQDAVSEKNSNLKTLEVKIDLEMS